MQESLFKCQLKLVGKLGGYRSNKCRQSASDRAGERDFGIFYPQVRKKKDEYTAIGDEKKNDKPQMQILGEFEVYSQWQDR